MKIVVGIGLLFSLFVASADAAAAIRWKSEFQRVSIAPGGVQPRFGSSCAPRVGGQELEDAVDHAELARRWKVWLEWMTVEELDAVLRETSGDRRSTISAAELSGLDHEGLVELLEEDPELQRLVVAGPIPNEHRYIPCGRESATGYCVGGVVCASSTCKKRGKKEKWQDCETWVHNTTTFLCPNNSKLIYHCADPCAAPIPGWSLFLGGLFSTALFVRGRRRALGWFAR